ncbi:MAG: choice-of-anchor J domain-containing protein [Duncaniella sp.]|nr:choice-of-anchor J domain-containing protein [Duncaniella sp.]
MKKFLLSIFAVMTAAGFAGAETVELNVNDATGFDGTLVEEELKEDGSVKAAKHYQPINSFNLGGFDFKFSTTNTNESNAPAYYWSTSTTAADKQQQTIRLYNGTTMTITAPEGVNITKVEFTGSNAGKNLAVTATPGNFALSGNNGTWTGSANSFSLTVSATWRVSKLVITTGEGGETPVDPTPGTGTLYEGLGEDDATCDWTFDETVWSWKGYNNKYYLNASAFGKDEAIGNTYYAVSPVIDLSEAKSASMTFDHAAKFQTTLRDLCGAVVRLEGATEWIALTIPTWPEAGSWTFVSSGDIDLSAYAGKKIQLGFKYGSSDAGADTWEIKNLKISSEGSAVNPPVDPDPTPGDESTKENPYTVAQAIALGSDYKQAVWVKGFIVGYVDGKNYAEGCVFGNTAAEGAEVSKTNILIAGSKDETDVNNCMPVQLPTGAERNALNLNANPANLGKELTINAYLTKYFAVPGLKKEGDATYEYVLNGEGSEPIDPPVVETAKFVKAAAIESGKKYLLVADGKAATGKVKDDKAYGYLLVDAVAIDGDVATASAAYAFTITAVEGAYTIQRPDGTYVAMKGIFNSFNFYASPEEWYEWVISINNDGTADIWNSDADKYVAYDAEFSSYGCYPEDKAETCIKPTLYVLDEGQSGVAEIVIDENAPVEYFNIQGVKVNIETAAPGLYIRRQGNVATKVIVK